MSDEVWKTIFTHADAVFDNFTVRLRGQFPALNEEDIRYCCMVRMHLSQAEIASVVCLEKDSVKKRLKRIRTEKLASAKGSTLEEILSRLKNIPPAAAPDEWKQQAVSLLKNAPYIAISPCKPPEITAGRLTLHTKQALQSGSRSRPGETYGKIY